MLTLSSGSSANMEAIFLFSSVLLLSIIHVESSSVTGQCSSEEMRRTVINRLLTTRGCNDYACGGFQTILVWPSLIIHNTSAMHTVWSEMDSATEQCSTEEMRRAAINNILADKGCSDYACGKYLHSRVL